LLHICSAWDELKVPPDLKEIAKAKQLAEVNQKQQRRHRHTIPERRLPSRAQWKQIRGTISGQQTTVCIGLASAASFRRLVGSKAQTTPAMIAVIARCG
jgi:hypothetical protein